VRREAVAVAVTVAVEVVLEEEEEEGVRFMVMLQRGKERKGQFEKGEEEEKADRMERTGEVASGESE